MRLAPWPLVACALALLPLATAVAFADPAAERAAVQDLLDDAKAREANDPGASRELATQAVDKAETLGDERLLARAQNRLGVACYLLSDYACAYERYGKSLEAAQAAGDDNAVADAVNNLGVLHYLWGNWPKALELYQRGLEMRQQANDRKGMAVAYNNLGNVAYAAHRYAEALDYYQQSQGIYQALGESRYLCSSHNNVGLLQLHMGDRDRARASFLAARALAGVNDDGVCAAQSADHLGLVDLEEGDLAAARAAFTSAIEQRRQLGDLQGLALSLNNLGSAEIKAKDYAAAGIHLAEALALAHQLAVPEIERDALELRATLQAEQGHWRAALEDNKAFTAIKERIFSERSSRQLAETRALFELETKDHEIAALKQEKSFQRASRLALAAAILLLLAIVALLWSRNRLQQQAQKAIEQKNLALEAAQRELQEAARTELAHLARVAGLGEMTAAVAHELNQPLAAILTNAQIAAAALDENSPDTGELSEVVDDITLGARRAWELLRHLRELARNGEIRKEPVELGALLQETLTIAGAEARLRHVELDLDKPPDPVWVEGDRVHLQQIVLNLVQNGIDAVADQEPAHRHLKLAVQSRGDTVEVAARDQGRPVGDEVLERMFEPFYTTKNEGLGMGLAICKRLIEALGGEMWARRNPERGLTVGFRLRTRLAA